jgi:hypothetical protein
MWYTNVVRRTLVEMTPIPSYFLDIPKMEKIVCHIGVGAGTQKKKSCFKTYGIIDIVIWSKIDSLLI